MNVVSIRHLMYELLIEEHNLELQTIERNEDVFRDYIQKFSINIKKKI